MIHEGTHTKEKLFSCSKCSEKFTTSIHLRLHRETHLRIHTYNCPYCEKGFRLEKQMYRHFSTEHPKEIKGPMTCEHCGKIYIGRTNLKAHQKSTHNEIACAECGKIVKVGKLLYHIQQYHTANENKKYKCPTQLVLLDVKPILWEEF